MLKRFLTAATLSVALATPAGVGAAAAADTAAPVVKCTKTSSGSCIRGGQFCPQSSYGKAGYDAVGRRYVCKGDRVHPHWMK
jgi:hypothetical protein